MLIFANATCPFGLVRRSAQRENSRALANTGTKLKPVSIRLPAPKLSQSPYSVGFIELPAGPLSSTTDLQEELTERLIEAIE